MIPELIPVTDPLMRVMSRGLGVWFVLTYGSLVVYQAWAGKLNETNRPTSTRILAALGACLIAIGALAADWGWLAAAGAMGVVILVLERWVPGAGSGGGQPSPEDADD